MEDQRSQPHRVRDIAQAVTIALLLWFGMTTMQTHDKATRCARAKRGEC